MKLLDRIRRWLHNCDYYKCKDCPLYWIEGYGEDFDEGCRVSKPHQYDFEGGIWCLMPKWVRGLRLKFDGWREERYWAAVNRKMEAEQRKKCQSCPEHVNCRCTPGWDCPDDY